MKIGIIGLGKLGMSVVLGINLKGHDVMGYAVVTNKYNQVWHFERSCRPCRNDIYCSPKTPHDPEYEGITRIPESPKDFDYRWIISAVQNLSEVIEEKGEDRVIIIISTVLPGTIRKYILPKLTDHIKLCYNPFFIAMGTTIRDFYNPEFILFGVYDDQATKVAETFYKTISNAPLFVTTIENAEMIKVSYNTYIGMKIVFANTLMEVCHKLEYCDVDVVTDALSIANRRLMSPAYLRGGMGDGGGCHPRDNIALSRLASQINLKHDCYADVMQAREDQTDWLADLIVEHDGEKVILGKSFKPETNLTVGSPSLLLRHLLEERHIHVQCWDPYVDGQQIPDFAKKKAVYFIATKHTYFQSFNFPKGSVVLDPFRYIDDQPDVRVIRIGSTKILTSSLTQLLH